MTIRYRGADLEAALRLDLVVERQLVVEVESAAHLAPIHRSQLLTYLKLNNLHLGLLVNFNVTTLRTGIRRVSNS